MTLSSISTGFPLQKDVFREFIATLDVSRQSSTFWLSLNVVFEEIVLSSLIASLHHAYIKGGGGGGMS